jgi:hypothetical protein
VQELIRGFAVESLGWQAVLWDVNVGIVPAHVRVVMEIGTLRFVLVDGVILGASQQRVDVDVLWEAGRSFSRREAGSSTLYAYP